MIQCMSSEYLKLPGALLKPLYTYSDLAGQVGAQLHGQEFDTPAHMLTLL